MWLGEDGDGDSGDELVGDFFKRHGESDSDSDDGQDGAQAHSDGQGADEQTRAGAASEAEAGGAEEKDSPVQDVSEQSSFQSPLLAQPVRIVQERVHGIGFQLWPAATYLCRYLEAEMETELRAMGSETGSPVLPSLGKSLADVDIIELGAGVGLLGLFLASLGCPCVAVTDLPEVLPILQRNLDVNPELEGRVSVQPLTWGTSDWRQIMLSGRGNAAAAPASATTSSGNSSGSSAAANSSNSFNGYAGSSESSLTAAVKALEQEDLDLGMDAMITARGGRRRGRDLVVVLADCVYWPSLFQPLADTLEALCKDCGATVLMCHTRRWKKDSKFFQLCSRRLQVTKIHETVETGAASGEEEGQRIVTRIYRMQAKGSATGVNGSAINIATPTDANGHQEKGEDEEEEGEGGQGPVAPPPVPMPFLTSNPAGMASTSLQNDPLGSVTLPGASLAHSGPAFDAAMHEWLRSRRLQLQGNRRGFASTTAPLLEACREGNLVVSRWLLDQGEPPHVTNSFGYSPLLMACAAGSVETCELLLERGYKFVRSPNNFGVTPMLIASENGHVQVCRWLATHGALLDIDIPNDHGYSPMYMACEKMNHEVAQFLLATGGGRVLDQMVLSRKNWPHMKVHLLAWASSRLGLFETLMVALLAPPFRRLSGAPELRALVCDFVGAPGKKERGTLQGAVTALLNPAARSAGKLISAGSM